jgi:hypothetical protein
VDGVLGHNLLLSRAFFHNLVWLLRSLSHELFLFPRWNSGYHEAFLTNFFFFHDGIMAITKPFSRTFSFFTMEFWLSRSLSHELFLFHDGILATTKPFSRTFSFFTMEFCLSRSLSHELFLFSRWNSGYHEAFLTNFFFFHDGILEIRNLGEDSFYIYITKSIYTGSASLKTLPLDLEPPLQGKEYGPPYSNATKKVKGIVHLARTYFFPEITYRHVIRIF